jgi:hypothetical protein
MPNKDGDAWPDGLEKSGDVEARRKKAIADAGAATEEQMRDSEAPSPKTPEELAAYITGLVDRPHDYGTCVYAMSLAATAAFNYVAGKLGVTGFQASCADMDIIRRTRHMRMGFILLKQAPYPQYDLRGRVEDWIEKSEPELAKEAARLLIENPRAHPLMIEHWRRLAALEAETT